MDSRRARTLHGGVREAQRVAGPAQAARAQEVAQRGAVAARDEADPTGKDRQRALAVEPAARLALRLALLELREQGAQAEGLEPVDDQAVRAARRVDVELAPCDHLRALGEIEAHDARDLALPDLAREARAGVLQPASRKSSARPRTSACRWGRSRCTTWWASTWPCTPAARWPRRFPIASCRRRLCDKLVERGRIGQKVGKGFFDYGPPKGGKPPRGTDSAEVAKLIDDAAPARTRKFSQEEITDRLFLPMLVEATRVLEDKIVPDVRDVDLGLIFGIGFPPFRGGLFFWADQMGAAKIVEKLKQYAPLGKRFEPTAMLTELAATSAKFYD